MEANSGKSFQMQILFSLFPRISLHCKLVPVQKWSITETFGKQAPAEVILIWFSVNGTNF